MSKVILQVLFNMTQLSIFAHGEMPERLIGTVLKTVEGDEPSGGSNPSLSAECLFAEKRKFTKIHGKPASIEFWRVF